MFLTKDRRLLLILTILYFVLAIGILVFGFFIPDGRIGFFASMGLFAYSIFWFVMLIRAFVRWRAAGRIVPPTTLAE
jgi:membrane protein YdbS with pleckstrin-like domain